MKQLTLILSVLLVFAACKSTKKTSSETTTTDYSNGIVLNNYIDSVSYALGLLYGEGLKKQGFDDLNNDLLIEVFNQSINNSINADSALISQQSASPIVNNYFIKKKQIIADKNKAEGEAFLAANKTKKGVITTASGLQYKILKEGNGKSPEPGSSVTVFYKGSLVDGKVFDQTKKGNPATFGVSQVIKGWTEGLQLMKEGAKFEFYIPANLGYGVQGAQGSIIGPNATLIFEVELVKVN